MSVTQQQRKKKSDGGQNIKVFIRVRPMNASEKAGRNFCCLQCPNSKELLVQERLLDKYSKKFSFDKVFPENSKQEDIYKTVAKPLVEEVLNGYNCTIFAYGQTGTGKTFTMEGDHGNVNINFDENPLAGIVPRCVNYIFDELRIQQMEFTMRVSYLELYNEELFDLLSPNDDLTKLRLYEDATRKGSCIIQGLEEVLVRSKMDVYNLIKKGCTKRQTAATLMNSHSSRSHTVFTVTIHIKETTPEGNEMLKTGKLHLVDLAGSENIGRSGSVDKRAREAGNINQSLLTVGRVITSLVEKAPHIPYRESKLTRLLQDALGGRTKTSIIATVSPASVNLEETLSTLDYAYRAKNIQNRPEANQKLNKKELITEYSAEIDRLQRDLLATREKNGVYLANENYQDMISTIEEQSKEILDKINYLRLMEEEKEKLKETFTEVSSKLELTSDKLTQSEAHLVETKETLLCTQKLLTMTAKQRDEESYLKSAHKATETKLLYSGKELISVAHTTTTDIDKLHGKIARKSKVEADNRQIGDNFSVYLANETDRIRANLQDALNMQKTSLNTNMSQLDSILKESGRNLKEMLDAFKDLSCFASNSLNDLTKAVVNNEEKHIADIKKYTDQIVTDGSLIEKGCEQVFMSKVSPFITALNLCLVSFDSLFLNLKEDNAKKLTEIENFCELASKEQTVNLQLLESQLESLLDSFRNYGQFQNQQVKLLKEEEDEHIEALDKIVQAALTAKEKRQNIYRNYSEITAMQKNVELKTENKYKKICETSNKMVSDVPHNQARVKSLVHDICQFQDTVSSEYFEKSSNIKSAHVEISADMESHNTERSGAFADLYKNASVFKTDMSFSISSGTKQLQESSKALNTILTEKINQNELTLKKKHEIISGELDTICSSVSKTLENVSDSHCEHDANLQNSNSKVQHLFNNQMKVDIPTGQTPVRKTYAYPKNLPETSPHEKLLSRFRIDNCLTTPVPDTELEESSGLSNSICSSENSEIDSANEAFLVPQNKKLRRSGSFKERPTFELARTTTNIPKEASTCNTNFILAKSSSVSCIGELKENKFEQKKRELRGPSKVTSYNSEKVRPRKILGLHN